jgi:hypothetical protein
LRYESVEIVDSLGESALVLDIVVKKEERNDMLKIIGNGSVGKCFEERFYCSNSSKIGLVEE